MQGEAVGRGAEGGHAVGELGGLVEEVGEVIKSEAALGGGDGGAGEEADHLVEEAVAGEGELVACLSGGCGGFGNGAGVVGLFRFVAPGGGEGAEVVGAAKEGEGFFEGIRIELPGEVPGEAGEEGGKDGGGGEVVGVGFAEGGEAGVEVVGNFFAVEDADGGGELCIESRDPVDRVHGQGGRGVEVCDLAEGVDAGVSPAGAMDAEGFFGDDGEGVLDLLLNSVAIGLDLPPTEGASVVGDGEFESHGRMLQSGGQTMKAEVLGALAREGSWCDNRGVKTGVLLIVAGVVSLSLSSCFLITVPIKATGEIVEKSAYATRDLSARGIRKMKESRDAEQGYEDPGYYEEGPDYGSDEYYEQAR